MTRKAYSTGEMVLAAQHGEYFVLVGGNNELLGMKVRMGRTGIMWTLGPKAGELLSMSADILPATWVKE